MTDEKLFLLACKINGLYADYRIKYHPTRWQLNIYDNDEKTPLACYNLKYNNLNDKFYYDILFDTNIVSVSMKLREKFNFNSKEEILMLADLKGICYDN